MGVALEEHRDVKSSPLGGHTESINDLRHVSVADGLHVLAVDDPVIVEILVLDVTRTHLSEGALVWRGGDVLLILEETVGDKAE